ncbi:uncharacterized protein LOC128394873 [Panonychus citri]|uniref:uncharacterized protein LOC128394873 n=1 Tax=Panonychus citri TaxID=50023 RepID=UPI002306E1B3|nr:uncharacterized protein LOC128394873 [Panonychus citri]
MLLNELPDDCLLTIFGNFDCLDDFINCSKVCTRWAFLTSYHLNKVKCLLTKKTTDNSSSILRITNPLVLLEPNLHKLLQNLQILDIASVIGVIDDEKIKRIINSNQSISTLIYPSLYDDGSAGYCFAKVDSQFTMNIDSQEIVNPDNLIQIFFRNCIVSCLSKYMIKYQNLIRIHITDIEHLIGVSDVFYNGPLLVNLKILELTSASYDGTFIYTGFHLMDFCPALESAFFYSETIDYYVNESIKNFNLRDLVIQYMEGDYSQEWSSLRSLLSKFPNLKHLALRGNNDISDLHVEQMVQLLPKLKLLDCRQSPNVTHKSSEYLKGLSQESNRSITIYYNCDNQESGDWPKIDHEKNQICYGLDFMKHCFFRSYYNLPLLMAPFGVYCIFCFSSTINIEYEDLIMLLNELPDDCLLTIFGNFDCLDDFINCSKVCTRWAFLTSYHLNKVKCLLTKKTTDNSSSILRITNPLVLLEPNLHKLLQNLQILDIASAIGVIDDEKIKRIIYSNQSISTLIYPPFFEKNGVVGWRFAKVDSQFTMNIDSQEIDNPDSFFQIFFRSFLLSRLKEYTTEYQNLLRIHITDIEFDYILFKIDLIGLGDVFYNGPLLVNLKILELTSASYDGTFIYPGFHLMDFCPALESAFFYSETIDYYVNESIKNFNLRDLVIQYMEGDYSQEWSSLRSLLSKFPNLKHLALRGNNDISDLHVEQMVQLLPKLKLLDCRQSPNVTHKSSEYLKGLNITIYYNCDNQESGDWPKIDNEKNRFCYGLDFMKHCFFRSYKNLPLLMAP